MTNQSALGYKWLFNNKDNPFYNHADYLKVDASILPILHSKCKDFYNKNDISLDEAEVFLNPTLKNLMPEPDHLLDMKEAVTRIEQAVVYNEKITIFGDYDVDGATSSATIKRFLNMINKDCDIYIPDRIIEGYGPNSKALVGLKEKGTDLVITVDCGTVAFEPIQAAKDVGLDVIVIDHHIGASEKPASVAVVNPNRFDETSEMTYLCGAGVVFMMLVSLNRRLRESGYYAKHKLKPNLIELLDLVALGTICDVVPLRGVNRAFVQRGLEVMQETKCIGLRALMQEAEIKGDVNEYHLGFGIGPRINAGGRIGESWLGSQLLSTRDESEANRLAKYLTELNQERKDMEAEIQRSARLEIEAKADFINNDKMLFAGSEEFHQGVIGIVAGRIKDFYKLPTAIMEYRDGVAKASCRSIEGVDIGAVIMKANEAGILIAGGGHAMAGGFSVEIERLEELKEFINNLICEDIKIARQNLSIKIDNEVMASAVSNKVHDNIQRLAPFGQGNGKPVFYTKNLKVKYVNVRGQKHLAVTFHCSSTNQYLKTIIFNFEEDKIGQYVHSNKNKTFDIVYTMRTNDFMGNRSIEVNLLDCVCR